MTCETRVSHSAFRSFSIATHISSGKRWETIVLCAALACLLSAAPLQAFAGNTVTALQVSSGATVGGGVVVTFTASVTDGGGAVKSGSVTFCDASAKYCEDLAVLGTAPVNSSGVASVKKVFAPGEHKISAYYTSATGTLGPSSVVQTVDVPVQVKPLPVPVITKTGRSNPLPVKASVSVVGRSAFTGTLSIVQTQDKQALATLPVGPSTTTSGFAPLNISDEIIFADLPNFGGAFVVGDFNGDGLPDLAATVNTGFGDDTEAFVGVALNDPSHPGQFLPAQGYLVSSFAYGLVAGDFNGDGVLDLITYTYNSSSALLLGDPAHPGQFSSPISISNPSVFQTAADLNQDGYSDLITTDGSGIDVFYNSPSAPGQFSNETVYPGGSGNVTVADVNGDGVLDMIAASSDPKHPGVAVFLGETGHPGSFLAPVVYPIDTGGYPSQVLVGDFNQDGHADLGVLIPLPNLNYELQILLNDPASPGQFSAAAVYPISAIASGSPGLAVGDFNGDGSLDFATTDITNSGVNVLYGDPKSPGKFLPEQPYPLDTIDPYGDGSSLVSLAAADFNADGLTDLSSILETDNFLGYYPIGVLLGQQTQTASVTFPSVAYDPTMSPLAQALYSGDDNYDMIGSCDIDLAANEGAPVLTDIHADVSDVGATVLWYWTGDAGAVDYGTTTALGSTTDWQRAAPSERNGPSYIRLSGLKPATKYYYRIRAIGYFSGCSHWTTTSAIGSFTTAK